MIYVCDALMGAGKSCSAISLMNERSNDHFVYITPYSAEAERIQSNCPTLEFELPRNDLKQYNFSKVEHTRHILASGRNIATTHSAFKLYSDDMIENIQKYNYTLIIDEAVEILRETSDTYADLKLFIDGGYASCDANGVFSTTQKEYGGGALTEMYGMLRRKNIIRIDGTSEGGEPAKLVYWLLNPTVLRAFKNTYILTYLFDGQDMRYFLDTYHFPYQRIGITIKDGGFSFSDDIRYMPEYAGHLSDMIHILDAEKINAVGSDKYALSASWFKNSDEKVIKELKDNLYNYFRHIINAPCKDIMWSTYKDSITKLRGRGYSNQVVSFNAKATNDYRNRNALAYCVNVFASPNRKVYFSKNGMKFDEDLSAVSCMVQWIWRSAIRDGKEIWIYIPSRRMRELLIGWMREVEEKYRECEANKKRGD